VANDLNQCQFIGRLGKDPETKFLPNGGQVTNISIACGSSWTDKSSGQKQEKTDWIPVVFFGKLAEIAGQYLTKGSKIFVSGNFKTRKWQDQSGQDRYTTEIVVDGFGGVMQMLDSKSDGQGGGQNNAPPQQAPAPVPAPTPQKDYAAEYMAMTREQQTQMWPSYTDAQRQLITDAVMSQKQPESNLPQPDDIPF